MPEIGAKLRARELRRPGTFVVALIVGLVITWLLFAVVGDRDANARRIEFGHEASDISADVQTSLDLALEQLLAIQPFFASSEEVTREEFMSFVQPALDRHPSIYAINGLPRIVQSDRGAFERKVRAESSDSFVITVSDSQGQMAPAPQRPEYFPIYFGQPVESRMLGVDLGAHPEQGPYVAQACAGTAPVATPPLSLIEDPSDVLSVIALNPVRLQGTSDTEPCDGLAMLILRVRPVIEQALALKTLEQFDVALMDVDAPLLRQVVFKNFKGSPDDLERPGFPVARQQITFADQQWQLIVTPSVGSALAPGRPPWWILAAGVVLSLLAAYSLAAFMTIGGLRRQVDEALELGQYKLGRKLGEGGMGKVYEAHHRMLARAAAIKLIPPAALSGDIGRFEREARATAKLESPHTIGIYDFGKTPDGAFYYVMEFLHGTDLHSFVQTHGPLPVGRAVYLLLQVCESLAEAHAAGLVHRDVKPANLFVCRFALEYDFVKVLDFGLVTSVESDRSGEGGHSVTSVELTKTGTVLGTPAFMAPEMVNGADVDGRADIYSLACVAYWLIAGRFVFDSDHATAMIAQHLAHEPPLLGSLTDADVPIELEDLLLTCLAKAPDDRPPTIVNVQRALTACMSTLKWTAEDARTWWERHPSSGSSSSSSSSGSASQ